LQHLTSHRQAATGSRRLANAVQLQHTVGELGACLHVRPWFADRPIDKITPADVRRWQAQLARDVGPSTVAHCRSLALRIFQFAMDEGAIDANPVRKVPPLKRRVDPDKVFREAKRRALTPEEAGRLLACFPLFWWDHMLTLLGTGLRFGELAGLRRRRVHLDRPLPVLEVGPPATRPAGSAAASSHGPRATPASARYLWPRWWSRRSAAGSLPAATSTTSCSPAPAAAPAAAVGRACPEAPEPCCRATTSAGPTRVPWPSWPTRRFRCDLLPGGCCGLSATAGRSASTNSRLDSPPTVAA
jgi:hypothetical protein